MHEFQRQRPESLQGGVAVGIARLVQPHPVDEGLLRGAEHFVLPRRAQLIRTKPRQILAFVETRCQLSVNDATRAGALLECRRPRSLASLGDLRRLASTCIEQRRGHKTALASGEGACYLRHVSDFAGVPLTETLAAGLRASGIVEPTPIQRAAAAEILAGHHVVLQSGTGTGKTLAYLLPVLHRLATEPLGRAVVVAPSAELAIQIVNVARRYKEASVSVAGVVAGASHKHTKQRLQKSTRLIVGSPGRILELFGQRKLKGVTTLVLDEPDPILVGDVPRGLREVLSRPEPKLQLIVVGATLGPKTESLLDDSVGDRLVRLSIRDEVPLQHNIAHYFVRVAGDQRDVELARFIDRRDCRRAIVFVSEPRQAAHLFRHLSEHGIRTATLSDERNKQQRRAALEAFAAGKQRVLVATDAAGRGIDVPAVDWVLHYGLATSAPVYVHRAGRTGRAGRSGTSVSFVTERELPTLQRFARELHIDCAGFPRRRP